jgi:hypothetical protein
VLIVHVVVLGGCGGSTNPHATIRGTVIVNGKPIKEGKLVYFGNASGADGRGSAKIVDGKYILPNVPLGSTAFTFFAAAETGKTIAGPGGVPEPERVNIIPPRIASEGITREVTGDSTQDFDLDKEGGKEK